MPEGSSGTPSVAGDISVSYLTRGGADSHHADSMAAAGPRALATSLAARSVAQPWEETTQADAMLTGSSPHGPQNWNHESPHRVRGPASAHNHSTTETPAVASGKRHEGAHPWMPWMPTGTSSSGCPGHAWGNFQGDPGTAAAAASMAAAVTPAGDSTTDSTYPSGRTDGSFDRANTVFSLTEMD